MTTYNYDTFKTEDYDFTNEAGPMIGQRAPDFLLTTIDNKKKTLLDFDGDYLVLELGSVTCPLFHTRREGMRLNAREYPNLTFSVLYVREAHPGAIIPAHKSFDDKKMQPRVLEPKIRTIERSLLTIWTALHTRLMAVCPMLFLLLISRA